MGIGDYTEIQPIFSRCILNTINWRKGNTNIIRVCCIIMQSRSAYNVVDMSNVQYGQILPNYIHIFKYVKYGVVIIVHVHQNSYYIYWRGYLVNVTLR